MRQQERCNFACGVVEVVAMVPPGEIAMPLQETPACDAHMQEREYLGARGVDSFHDRAVDEVAAHDRDYVLETVCRKLGSSLASPCALETSEKKSS